MSCAHSQSLFEQASAVSISRYISYAKHRMSRKALIKQFPEADTLDRLFNRKALLGWREMMRNHNSNIERGEKMGLLPAGRSLKRLRFDSLDTYMLTMHGDTYAAALLSLASFGERVQKARDENRADGDWCIGMPYMITRERWGLLRKRVDRLVNGIERELLSLDSGPFLELLKDALHKVSASFAILVAP